MDTSQEDLTLSNEKQNLSDEKKKRLKINVDDVLLNLKILSHVKEYEKLNSNPDVLKIDNSYGMVQALSRWFNNEGRDSTIQKITDVVNDSLAITDFTFKSEFKKTEITSETYFKYDNSHVLQKFLVEMSNAIRGLENLKITYNTDVSIQSRLTILIDKLKDRIEKINNVLRINTTKKVT